MARAVAVLMTALTAVLVSVDVAQAGRETVHVAASRDVCASYGDQAVRRSVHVVGGQRTTYNRAGSLYSVCEGFGAPAGVHFSPAMKCALLAAAASFGGPGVDIATSRLCDTVSVVNSLQSGRWLGAAAGKACGYFSDVFAGGVGIVAAGATAETGPGAVAIGLVAYRALSAGLKVACGGLLDGGAATLGTKIESSYELHIATAILRKGRCLALTKRFGQYRFSTTGCPPGPNLVLGRVFGPYQRGFGAPQPAAIEFGGDGSADMLRLKWRNWGGREAFATGIGRFQWPGQSTATGITQGTLDVELSGIRVCHGQRAYTRMVRWMPQFGEHFHPEYAFNACEDKYPPYTPLPTCPDLQFPDGARATQIQVDKLSCAQAASLILNSPAESYLVTSGGRYMQDGFFCATDGYPQDPSTYTPDPGPSYGCGLDQRQLIFYLTPASSP